MTIHEIKSIYEGKTRIGLVYSALGIQVGKFKRDQSD